MVDVAVEPAAVEHALLEPGLAHRVPAERLEPDAHEPAAAVDTRAVPKGPLSSRALCIEDPSAAALLEGALVELRPGAQQMTVIKRNRETARLCLLEAQRLQRRWPFGEGRDVNLPAHRQQQACRCALAAPQGVATNAASAQIARQRV